MSKSPSKNQDPLVLEYNLFDLPTAQHKAGLAGLLLMVESMKQRKMKPVPEVLSLTRSSARFVFTEQSMEVLFNDLYASEIIEVESRKKWQGAAAKHVREEEVKTDTGRTKTQKVYVYDVLRPKGEFLRTLFPDGDGVWLKLWQEMLWETLRGIPKARRVYQETLTKGRSTVGSKTWGNLKEAEGLRRSGVAKVEGISSSLFVGAQNVNAERVPYQGPVDHNLLLHFWTIVSLIFVPRVLSVDAQLSDVGYVLAIPEPSDLEAFVDDADHLLRSLETQKTGFRPAQALIELPEQGALEYLYYLTRHRVSKREVRHSLAAVECYHLEKQGNNIRMLAAERILADPGVLEQYEPLRTRSRNPLYKALRIRNLLTDQVWHNGVDTLFSWYPCAFFVHTLGETPKGVPFFGNDARRKFSDIADNLKRGGDLMNEEDRDDKLAASVHKLVGQFVRRRAEEKSGHKYKNFKDQRDDKGRVKYPQAYRETLEKVCTNAFLAMRSRKDQDFVEYFTGTIFSVPQFLPEEDFISISSALMTDWSTVKALSMLAISAHSYVIEAD